MPPFTPFTKRPANYEEQPEFSLEYLETFEQTLGTVCWGERAFREHVLARDTHLAHWPN